MWCSTRNEKLLTYTFLNIAYHVSEHEHAIIQVEHKQLYYNYWNEMILVFFRNNTIWYPVQMAFFNTGHIFMSKIATNITQLLCDIYCFQVLQHQNTDRYIKKTYHEYRPASPADNYKYYSISGWYWVRWIPIFSYLYMVLLLHQTMRYPLTLWITD